MEFDLDCDDLLFSGDDDSLELLEAIDDEDAESDERTEDMSLSQTDRAALLKEVAPMFDSIKPRIEHYEPELVEAYKRTGRDFDHWSTSSEGEALEALFGLRSLMHQLEKAILYGDEVSIGIARRRLQQRSQAVFAEAERLIAQSVVSQIAA